MGKGSFIDFTRARVKLVAVRVVMRRRCFAQHVVMIMANAFNLTQLQF